MHDFKWGVADRGASVRIPRTTETSGQGYFEDRRPASNVDPYLASAIIADTMCNNNKHTEELLNTYKNFKTVSKPEERYL
jgi:glutamine synthetase